MANKFLTYRCNWKHDNTGYSFEEAMIVKSKIDLVNLASRKSVKNPRYGIAEIVSDPRGGCMIRCKVISE